MEQDIKKDSNKPGQAAPSGEPVNGSNLLGEAQALWLELRELSHDRLWLAGLEAQRAGMSLVIMIAAGLLVAVLLNGLWVGILAAAVQWLVENGLVMSNALLIAVAFNLLLVLILCIVIRRKSDYLKFPVLLRSLKPLRPSPQDSEK